MPLVKFTLMHSGYVCKFLFCIEWRCQQLLIRKSGVALRIFNATFVYAKYYAIFKMVSRIMNEPASVPAVTTAAVPTTELIAMTNEVATTSSARP
jgi:hypothetical protein